MAKIGYFLSCEEWGPAGLMEQARIAEDAGFEALWTAHFEQTSSIVTGEDPHIWDRKRRDLHAASAFRTSADGYLRPG